MSSDERLAIIVSPAANDFRGEQGGLDGDAVRERLLLPDAQFDVRTLDPAVDLAEQLDECFDARPAANEKSGLGDAVLFYASADVRFADDELFLCLDPSSPDTGDALGDVASVLVDRAHGPILIIVDARAEASDDPMDAAEAVRTARAKLKTLAHPVELIIAVRTRSEAPVTSCSPLTRALLEVMDETDPEAGLDALETYELLSEREDIVGHVRAFGHLAVEDSFMLVPAQEVELDGDASPAAETPAPDSVVHSTPSPSQAATESEEASPPPSSVRSVPPPSRIPSDLNLPKVVISTPPPAITEAVDTGPSPTTISTAPGPISTRPGGPASSGPASIPPPPNSEPNSFPPPAQADAAAIVAEARALTEKKEYEGALAAYRRVLGLGNLAKDVRGHVYLRMGSIKAAQAKAAEAIANFEKALTLVKESDVPRVLDALVQLYLREKDYRAASATQERIIKGLAGDQARFDALLRYGRDWKEIQSERLRARQMLERAERLDPNHREMLVMLKELGEAEGRVEEVLGLRQRIADVTVDHEEKAHLLFDLAKELSKRSREDDAVRLYEAALDAFPSRFEPLAAIAELLSEKQEWSVLEASYRRMISRLPRVEPAAVRKGAELELWRRLGLLVRDHMDDHALALQAFCRAAEAKPDDATLRKMAVDAARTVGNAIVAEEHLLALTTLEPRDARVYRFLFDSFMKRGEVERAGDVAAVLIALDAANDRERVVFESNKLEGTPQLRVPLGNEAWLLIHADDLSLGPVAKILDAAGPAAAAAMAEIIAKSQSERLPDPKFRVDLAATTVSAARALAYSSRLLGLDPPQTYFDDKAVGSYSVILADPPATRVGSGALRGRSLTELICFASRHMTYQVPRYRLLALSPTIDDLSATFLAMVAVVTRDIKGNETMRNVVKDLSERIETWLGADELEALTVAVEEFTEAGGRVDLMKYVAAVERTSLRAGLLLSGDLRANLELAKEGTFNGGYRDTLSLSERVDELLSFSVSETYADLRLATLGSRQQSSEDLTAHAVDSD